MAIVTSAAAEFIKVLVETDNATISENFVFLSNTLQSGAFGVLKQQNLTVYNKLLDRLEDLCHSTDAHIHAHGLALLELTWGAMTPVELSNRLKKWLQIMHLIFESKGSENTQLLAAQTILKLLVYCLQFKHMSGVVSSSYAVKLVPALLERIKKYTQHKLAYLNVTYALVRLFTSSFRQSVNDIRTVAFLCLEDADSLVRHRAATLLVVLTQLQVLKRSNNSDKQKHDQNVRTGWEDLATRSVGSLVELCVDHGVIVTDEAHAELKHSLTESLTLSELPTAITGVQYTAMFTQRLLGLGELVRVLLAFLSSSTSVLQREFELDELLSYDGETSFTKKVNEVERIPVGHIIAYVTQVLRAEVSANEISEFTGRKVTPLMLWSALPSLQEQALSIIEALVEVTGRGLTMFVHSLSRELIEFSRMQSTVSLAPLQVTCYVNMSLRKKLFDTVALFASELFYGAGVHALVSELVPSVLTDLTGLFRTFVATQQTSAVIGGSLSHHSKKRKRKKATPGADDYFAEEERSNRQPKKKMLTTSGLAYNTSNDMLAHSTFETALTAASFLRAVLPTCGPLLPSDVAFKVDKTLTTVLVISEELPVPSALLLELYECLRIVSCASSRLKTRAGVVPYSVPIFSKGLTSTEPSIRATCGKALECLRLVVHPRTASLVAPAVFTSLETSLRDQPRQVVDYDLLMSEDTSVPNIISSAISSSSQVPTPIPQPVMKKDPVVETNVVETNDVPEQQDEAEKSEEDVPMPTVVQSVVQPIAAKTVENKQKEVVQEKAEMSVAADEMIDVGETEFNDAPPDADDDAGALWSF